MTSSPAAADFNRNRYYPNDGDPAGLGIPLVLPTPWAPSLFGSQCRLQPMAGRIRFI